jgi:arylsulfatase A-like enzyme
LKNKVILGLAAIGAASFVTAFTLNKKEPKAPSRPNIVVIYADDLGWGEISAYGNKRLNTPNIDALGKEGVRFTQAYSSAPICSPSRAGLLTGRYQQRFGFEFLAPNQLSGKDVKPDPARQQKAQRSGALRGSLLEPTFDAEAFKTARKGLPESEITLAEVLKASGYSTAVIGKWHLGDGEGFYPDLHGFDYHFGIYTAASLFTTDLNNKDVISRPPYYSEEITNSRDLSPVYKNRQVVIEKEYLTDKLATEATQFIESNKSKPFFLYLPFTAVHDPMQAKKVDFDGITSVQDSTVRIQLAMTKALDDAVGRVVAKLKELGLEKNTLIFFASDNGGPTYYKAVDNSPLRGGKLSHFEGGIRVPYFIKYPAKLPAGKVYDLPVSNLDIYSTAIAATGAKLPDSRELDGVDLIPYVNGAKNERPHEALFWRSGYSKAVRKGDWKLYVNERNNIRYLFDLSKDISEKTDLSLQHPEILKELLEALSQWEKNKTIKPAWQNRTNTALDVEDEKYYFPI